MTVFSNPQRGDHGVATHPDFRPGRATHAVTAAFAPSSPSAGAPSPAGASPAADATGPGRAALASAAGTSWPATPQARPIETDSYLGRRRASAYRSRHAGAVGRRRWAGLLVVLGLLGMMPLPVCAWLGVPLTPAATMAALGSLLTGAVLVLLAAPPRFVPEAMESRPGGEFR